MISLRRVYLDCEGNQATGSLRSLSLRFALSIVGNLGAPLSVSGDGMDHDTLQRSNNPLAAGLNLTRADDEAAKERNDRHRTGVVSSKKKKSVGRGTQRESRKARQEMERSRNAEAEAPRFRHRRIPLNKAPLGNPEMRETGLSVPHHARATLPLAAHIAHPERKK